MKNTTTCLLAGMCLVLALTARAAGLKQTLTPLDNRPAAPDFSLPDMDGTVHRLSDYRGRVVVVNFWATWCPPCREEMPSMQRAWKWMQKEGMVLLAINVGESEDQVFAFSGDYEVEFPLLLDKDSAVLNRWPARGLPTTYVVDPEGRLAFRAIGGREWDDPALLLPMRALKGNIRPKIKLP